MKLDTLLTPQYNLDNDSSFAYRKNKGISDAFKKIVEYYNDGFNMILEADIIKFFDNVDRAILLEKIFKNLPDNSLNSLIENGLNQEVGNLSQHTIHAHYFLDSVNGIPQGNSLSPLFANVYLSDFDVAVKAAGYNLVRYADDFVILCNDLNDAKKSFIFCKEFLETKLKLSIHDLSTDKEAKTRIVNPSYDKFKFLSIRFDGKNLWVDEKKIQSLKDKITEITEIQENSNLITVLTKTRNLLQGWLASFKFVDLERHTEEIDEHIDIRLYHTFRKFDFNIKSNYIRTIKRRNYSAQGLTELQRKKTGVTICMQFLNTIERNKIFL